MGKGCCHGKFLALRTKGCLKGKLLAKGRAKGCCKGHLLAKGKGCGKGPSPPETEQVSELEVVMSGFHPAPTSEVEVVMPETESGPDTAPTSEEGFLMVPLLGQPGAESGGDNAGEA